MIDKEPFFARLEEFPEDWENRLAIIEFAIRDDELAAGTEVSIALYPPAETNPIRMNGVVVRVFAHDDDPGPRRMAVQFTTFPSAGDRERLMRRMDARACCWPQ